jgi:hypothetical protein
MKTQLFAIATITGALSIAPAYAQQPGGGTGTPGSPVTQAPGAPPTQSPGTQPPGAPGAPTQTPGTATRPGVPPSPTYPAPGANDRNQRMTLNGCIAGTGTTQSPYMLSSVQTGTTGAGAVSGSTGTSSGSGVIVGPPAVRNGSAGQAPGTTANPPAATGNPQNGHGGSAPVSGATSGHPSTYRLSGSDVSKFAGKRVQIMGSVVPGNGSSTPGTPSEFKVESVQPATGAACQ